MKTGQATPLPKITDEELADFIESQIQINKKLLIENEHLKRRLSYVEGRLEHLDTRRHCE